MVRQNALHFRYNSRKSPGRMGLIREREAVLCWGSVEHA